MAQKYGNRGLFQMSSVEYRRKLRVPGLHTDGGGLYLRVGKEGARASWLAIYHFEQKRREMGLGSTDAVSLARAREKAAEVRELVDRGVDPLEAKRARRAVRTFGEIADEWIAAQTPNVRSDKSVARWRRAVGSGGYCEPLRGKRVDAVTTDDVLAVLQPIWHAKAATARTVRTYAEAVLGAAKALKLRAGDNPAAWAGNLEPLLGSGKRGSTGHAAIPWRSIPSFMAELRGRHAPAAKALELIILTAARTSEVLNATWGEIDLDRATWVIPAGRMKGGLVHSVPLSTAALALLRQLRPAKVDPTAFVFGHGKPLSNMSAAMLMRRMGRAETVHGFRSSFRDWAGSATNYPRELAEEALAHVVGDATERAYRRESALDRRRPMMQDWADYLASGAAGPAEDSITATLIHAAPAEATQRPRRTKRRSEGKLPNPHQTAFLDQIA